MVELLIGERIPTAGEVAYRSGDVIGNPLQFRREIGVVRQKDFLFNGSILDNITMNELEPDMDWVNSCTEIVGLSELVQEMPMQLNTLVGINKDGISGGQTQRVLIARALYGKPSLLVLDESTSNLDSVSEERLITKIIDYGCTVIYTSGRRDIESLFTKSIDLDQVSK